MKTFKTFTLLFFFLLILFSVYIYTLSLQNKAYWWDEAVYLGLAKNVFTNHTYGINVPSYNEIFRPPLFPILLSTVSSFGENVERIFSPVFYFLSVIVTYFFARKLFGKDTGLLSSIFLATSPLLIFFSSKILTESLSVFLFISSMFAFYKSFENRKFLVLTAVLTALAILAHYQEAVLFVIYAVILFTKTKKQISNLFFSKTFLLAILVFVATLFPWLIFSFESYGSIFGAVQDSLSQITTNTFFYAPADFYLRNISFLGLPIIFFVPALFFYKKFGEKEKVILISAIVIFLIFSFAISRKEERYLLPFSPIFYIFSAVGFSKLEKLLNRKYFKLVAIAFALPGLVVGVAAIQFNYQAGLQIKQAAIFLEQFPDKYVVAENYPVINYVSGKDVFPFPSDYSVFQNLTSTYNIHYVVVDSAELYQSPSYVSNLVNQFPTIATFGSSLQSEVRILKIQ